MSDDLISRKDFITEIEINIGNIYNPDIIKGMKFAIELIKSRPTVFNKKKVIEELKGEIELCVTHPLYPGRYIKKDRAVDIVEKGGVK